MSLSRSDDAKTIDYLVRNKICVVAFDHAVVQVVVAAPVPHVGSERRRQIFRLVLRIRSITWLDTKAGNQRTRSRATAKSSDTQTGAADILQSAPDRVPPRVRLPSRSPGTRKSNQDRQTEE